MHEVEAALADLVEAGVGDPVETVVFAEAGEILHVLALHLDAEQVDDIRPPGHGFLIVGEAADVLGAGARDQRAGSEIGHLDA